MEGVLDLDKFCRGIFLHEGKNFCHLHTVQFCIHLGFVVVPELSSACFLDRNVPRYQIVDWRSYTYQKCCNEYMVDLIWMHIF